MCYQNCPSENYEGECTHGKGSPFPCEFRNCKVCDQEFHEDDLTEDDLCENCKEEENEDR